MKRIVCISDNHYHLCKIPECDLVILAGDITRWQWDISQQINWLDCEMRLWLEDIKCPVVAVAGNHDVWAIPSNRDMVPKLTWKYLQDESTEVAGYKVYGLPWQLEMPWAFETDEHGMEGYAARIPEDTDILVCHQPPRGFGDLLPGGEHCGSVALLKRIEKIKPKIVVVGHIHSARGVYNHNGITIVNAALVNGQYERVNEPILVEVP